MREQFLKLLAKRPGDIRIGLIYADWLAEQGDPEEEYWRDPRIYTRAYTAIFDGYGSIYGDALGSGPEACFQGNGFGFGFGFGVVPGDGFGDGSRLDGFAFSNGNGTGSTDYCETTPNQPNQFAQEFFGGCL